MTPRLCCLFRASWPRSATLEGHVSQFLCTSVVSSHALLVERGCSGRVVFLSVFPRDNNNNNNNNPRTIFIVLPSWPLKVIARVHSVHLDLMNVEQRQAAVDPQTKPPDLGCESACRQLSSTTTIAIIYYYSARKLILIYRPTEGRRLSWPRHCRKGAHSSCQGCKSQWLCDEHNCPQRDSIPGPRALQSDMLPLDHCDLR